MRTTTHNIIFTLLASMRLSRCRAILPVCILALMMCLAQSAGAAALIQNVVETGGDNDANDTVVAKWTGQTWSDHAANEPILGLTTGQPYTVGLFGNWSPAFVDRAHRYTNAEPRAIPSYLLGQEYIMSGNDNRDNGAYTLDVTVSAAARVYMLIDNRLQDGDGVTPPTFSPNMQWIIDEGWTPVQNGLNRTADATRPDEVGIDESANESIDQYYSIYAKNFPAGTFQLKQADNAGRNMYGVVVTPYSPLRVVSCVAKCENNIIHVRYNRAVQLGTSDNYAYAAGFVGGVAYGADQSEVLVQTDPLEVNSAIELTILGVRDLGGIPLDPDPTICPLTYGFGSVTANFNDGLVPAGTVAGGTTAPAVGAEGALHLTDLGVGGQQNYWTIPFAGTFTLDRLQARWKTLLRGLGQADGFSFNIGEAAVAGSPFTYSSGINEEGATVGLSVTVDTFDNGEINPGSSDVGLEVRWNGARLSHTPVAGGHTHGPAELMTGTFVDTSVDLTPSGLVTFRHGAFVTTAQISGFTGIRVNQYEFAARTGGAAEDCWIDDVHINDFSMSGPSIGSQPSDVTAPENTTATFAVSGVDGIVPIAYQWFRNGVAIPGANGPSYSLSPVSADNGSKFSVRLANDCGTVTSQEATLTVVIAPIVLSTSSRGNCHAIYVTYNKAVQLDGTYGLVCSNGTPVVLLNQDFNAGDGGFTVETPRPFDGPWTYDAAGGRWSENGQDTENSQANTTILTSPAINVTQSGVAQLTFAHRYSFEDGNWDGGQVRVSVNGGAFTAVPASAFSQNGYNGAVVDRSRSELHGQGSFVNNSPNYTAGTIVSSCGLGVLQAGDTVRIQFFASSDSNTRGPNAPQWDLDSLQVTSYAVSSINIAGAFYGESQNVVCLRLPEGTVLVADVNTYRLLIRDVHGADGVVIQPNPTVSTFTHGAEYPTFRVLEKRFINIGGVNVSDLTGNPKFPNQPDQLLRDRTGFFETLTDSADNYGSQILGWAVAPVEADYRFWVSADDGAALYIAVDALPANKVLIAREPVWNPSRQYASCDRRTCGVDGFPQETQSAPIHLRAGQVVYLYKRHIQHARQCLCQQSFT